jgi:hypothetical protein
MIMNEENNKRINERSSTRIKEQNNVEETSKTIQLNDIN